MPISNCNGHWFSLCKLAMLLGLATWMGLALVGNEATAQSLVQSPVDSPVPAPVPATGTAPVTATPSPQTLPPGPDERVSAVVWVLVGLLIFGPAAAGIIWLKQRAAPADEG